MASVPTIYVLCGIQGSGKTTIARKLETEIGAKRYSYDEIEATNNLGKGFFIKQQMHMLAFSELSNGFNVVCDADYTSKTQRKDIITILSEVSCKKVVIVMSTPFEECKRRNVAREKPIPQSFLEWRRLFYEAPTLSEGWDEIIYY